MRIRPTQTWTIDGAKAAGPTEAIAPSKSEASECILPPPSTTSPVSGPATRLIVPQRYGRPRTAAEQAYYKAIIAETKALVDASRADRQATLDGWAKRIEVAPRAKATECEISDAQPSPTDFGPIVGDPNPGLGAGGTRVHREADGFVVNDPSVQVARPVTDQAVIRAGLKAEVKHRKQIGGTCGLYALGMVMDFWHEKDAANPTALVQAADKEPVEDPRGFVHFHHAPTDERYILDVALAEGYSAKGEMYQAELLAETADLFGYQASLRTEATMDDVYQVLDAGHPAIVAFNVDMNGEAGTPDSGARAHYAVLEGYFDHEGERYVIAKHSWSKTEDKVWRAKDFLASWSNLKTTKFYGEPGDGVIPNRPDLAEPDRLDLPDAGGGRADISHALARTLVEVVPPGEALTGGRRIAAQAQDR